MTTFDEFFAGHYDPVVRTLSLAVGDRTRAEDAAQEAFARAFRKWPEVSRMDRPAGWVIVVGMNQMKRWFARVDRKDHELVARVSQQGVPAAPDPAESFVTGAGLHAALDRLPPRQRATVVLRFLCELSTDEVAQALGCAPGTVKSSLHQALANLRVDLTDAQRADLDTDAPTPTRSSKGVIRHATR